MVKKGACGSTRSLQGRRRDCMKCEYCWHETGCDFPSGCGYGIDGSRQIGTRCYMDGKLLKNY